MFVVAVCSSVRRDCVNHLRRPLLCPTRALWYCERYPSRFGNVLLRPGHAPRGRERETTCECGAFVHESRCLCAAFFRLMGLLHFGFIALKASIRIQNRSWRIANWLGLHALFVVSVPRIRLTQVPYALGLR